MVCITGDAVSRSFSAIPFPQNQMLVFLETCAWKLIIDIGSNIIPNDWRYLANNNFINSITMMTSRTRYS